MRNVCLMCDKAGQIHLHHGGGHLSWYYVGESFCSQECLVYWLVTCKRIPNLEEELKRIRRSHD